MRTTNNDSFDLSFEMHDVISRTSMLWCRIPPFYKNLILSQHVPAAYVVVNKSLIDIRLHTAARAYNYVSKCWLMVALVV
jgi:hypothetical protein